MYGVFQELALAGMIPFIPRTPTSSVAGTGMPKIALNNAAGFFVSGYAAYLNCSGTSCYSFSNNIPNNTINFEACNTVAATMNLWNDNCAIFRAIDAQAIDRKIDDGVPLSGKFLGVGGFNSQNDCLSNPSSITATYKITNTTAQCQARYLIN